MDPALPVPKCKRPASAADARIDDREVHAGRHVRERVRERERTRKDLARWDSVRDVDDLDLGRDPLHHAVTRADEIVLEAEVCEKGDERHGA